MFCHGDNNLSVNIQQGLFIQIYSRKMGRAEHSKDKKVKKVKQNKHLIIYQQLFLLTFNSRHVCFQVLFTAEGP